MSTTIWEVIETEKKQTTIYISETDLKALKIKAVNEDTTITALIERAIKKLLAE